MTFEGDYIKKFYYSNQTKIIFNRKTAITLLLPMILDVINVAINESDEI